MHTVGTVPYILLVLYQTYSWYSTMHTFGTVPYILLVLYHTYCWYSTIHTVGTLPYILLVPYHTYCWYCTIHTVATLPYILVVLYHTYCWYCTIQTLHSEPRLASYASLAVGLSANALDRVGTHDLCDRSMWLDHLTTCKPAYFVIILAVTLGCNYHQLELGARDWHPDTTIKLLRIFRFLWPCIVCELLRDRDKTNKMQQSDVYYQHCLNMFRASLCPSSGEQRPWVTACGVLRSNRRGKT